EPSLCVGGVEAYGIAPGFAEKPSSNNVLGPRPIDSQRSAFYHLYPTAKLELVAFCVPAEIVVIVEDEDVCRRLALSIEIGGCEAADAAADDHKVVDLS